MPQLDFFFWKSNITIIFLFFFYFYLFVFSYLLIEVSKIFYYRKYFKGQLEFNNLYMIRYINAIERGLLNNKYSNVVYKLNTDLYNYRIIFSNYNTYNSLIIFNKMKYYMKKKNFINFFFFFEFLYLKNNILLKINDKKFF